MAWNKVSDKKYQIQLDGEYITIDMPFEKANRLFSLVVESGLVKTDESGEITSDPIVFLQNFKPMANLILTKFGPKGDVVEEGDCSVLGQKEVKDLIDLALDAINSFTSVFFGESEEKSTKSKKKSLAVV